jgi:hypothetical protein
MVRQSEGQERRQQRDRRLDGQSVWAQRGGQFLQLHIRSILSMELEQPLEQIGDRKERRVLRVLRTPTFPAHMRFVCDMFFEHLDQSGFANTGITPE